MSLTYPIKLEPDDNGTLLVTCPALPEITTFGEDEADVVEHARDAITFAFFDIRLSVVFHPLQFAWACRGR
jgi:predicted RNase H-like HicB family nuclease